MTAIAEKKVIYTARTHSVGGRAGEARSSDGKLTIAFAAPGSSGPGTNPEQLLAAGWSACFGGAMAVIARKLNVALPSDLSIDAEVDLIAAEGGYSLAARLTISAPGLSRDLAQQLIDAAEKSCPYSKALRGNIPASFILA